MESIHIFVAAPSEERRLSRRHHPPFMDIPVSLLWAQVHFLVEECTLSTILSQLLRVTLLITFVTAKMRFRLVDVLLLFARRVG